MMKRILFIVFAMFSLHPAVQAQNIDGVKVDNLQIKIGAAAIQLPCHSELP